MPKVIAAFVGTEALQTFPEQRGKQIPFLVVVPCLRCLHQSSLGTTVGMLQELLSAVGKCGRPDGLALSRTDTQILPPRSRSNLRLWQVLIPGRFPNIPTPESTHERK